MSVPKLLIISLRKLSFYALVLILVNAVFFVLFKASMLNTIANYAGVDGAEFTSVLYSIVIFDFILSIIVYFLAIKYVSGVSRDTHKDILEYSRKVYENKSNEF